MLYSANLLSNEVITKCNLCDIDHIFPRSRVKKVKKITINIYIDLTEYLSPFVNYFGKIRRLNNN
ncbi:HNH endonuclease domain-containing protein [[Pasteurella] aerogenes]